jgi:hypothetical protein
MPSVILATALILLGAHGASAQAPQQDWGYNLAINAWLPTIEGRLSYEVADLGDSFTVEPEDLLYNLEFAGLVAFGASNGEWSILGELIYLDAGAGSTRSLSVGEGVVARELELESWLVHAGGAYELVQDRSSTLGLLFGVRYFSTDSALSLTTSGQLFEDKMVTSSSSLWNGIVGIKGQVGLGERWYLPYHLDVGAGDSDLTWQALGGLGRTFKWGRVALSYRHLSFDQGDGGALEELSFGGGALSLAFDF